MTPGEALRIVQSLADGRCPVTGRQLPAESPYQQADVVRALHVAIRALEHLQRLENRKKRLPERAGRPWTLAEDEQLCAGFAAGKSIQELARIHQRTQGAIQSRLEKLGKLTPQANKRL